MTTPDQTVDERQRLVARLRDLARSEGWVGSLDVEVLRPAADLIEQDGKRVDDLVRMLNLPAFVKEAEQYLPNHKLKAAERRIAELEGLLQRLRFARPAGKADPIWDELHNALASPSEGNKKGDEAEHVRALQDQVATLGNALSFAASVKATGEEIEAATKALVDWFDLDDGDDPSVEIRGLFGRYPLKQAATRALNAALALSVSPAAAEGWTHINKFDKRRYRHWATALVEADAPVKVHAIVAIASDDQGHVWAIPTDQFKRITDRLHDGWAAPSSPAQEQEKGEQT